MGQTPLTVAVPELEGADRFTHGEEAYAGFAWDGSGFGSNHEGTPGEDKNP